MDYLIIATLRRLGVPQEAETLLDHLVDADAQSCPVVGEDLNAETLDVTFVVAGDNFEEVFADGRLALARALARDRAGHELLGISLQPAADPRPG